MSEPSSATASGRGAQVPTTTDRIQAGAAIAAAVIAAAAAVFSALAWWTQAEATRTQVNATQEQIRLNEELRGEKRAEYASRVSWWHDAMDNGRLAIQNRSPAPISGVFLRYRALSASDVDERSEGGFTSLDGVPVHDGSPVIAIDVIPPCTIIIIDQNALSDWMSDGDEIALVAWDHIQFADVNEVVWSINTGGRPTELERDTRPEFRPGDMQVSGDNFAVATPATDCGTG